MSEPTDGCPNSAESTAEAAYEELSRPKTRRGRKPRVASRLANGDLPNIFSTDRYALHSSPLPHMRQRLSLVEENELSFGDRDAYPYGLEPAIKNELVGLARALLSHGLRDMMPKLKEDDVAPLLMLNYPDAQAKRFLHATAKTLAGEIGADFVALDLMDIKEIVYGLSYMHEECDDSGSGRSSAKRCSEKEPIIVPPPPTPAFSGTLSTVDKASPPVLALHVDLGKNSRSGGVLSSSSLSDFISQNIASRLRSESSHSGDPNPNAQRIFNEPTSLIGISAFWTYICNCLAEVSPRSPKIIYVPDLAEVFSFPQTLQQFQHFLEQWRMNDNNPPMMIIGGSHHPPRLREEEDEEAVEMDDEHRGTPLQALFKEMKAASPRRMDGGNNGHSLLTTERGVITIVITPPRDPKTLVAFKNQLRTDRREHLFEWNYRRLYGLMKEYGVLGGDIPSLSQVDPRLIMNDLPFLESEDLRRADFVRIILLAQGLPHDVPLEALPSSTEHITLGKLKVALATFNSSADLQRIHYSKLAASPLARLDLDINSLNKHEKRLVSCIVAPESVSTRFQDIGALSAVKRALRELISFPLYRPDLFSHGILKEAVSGVLLFGPPGTGKTMLAKAVAAESGSNFMAINLSNVFDMWVGEGEKNVKAIFSLARKIAPCVIFVDEVDALLDSRSSISGRSSRVEIINEFMIEWDGLTSRNNGIIVMAATNRPFALDDAVLRRTPRRILVDLPDAAGREQILRLMLKDDLLDKDVELSALAARMALYSGSDIKNVCISAALRSVRDSFGSSDFSNVDVRVSESHPDPFERPPIAMAHFEAALGDVSASLSDDMELLIELRKWDVVFGEGSRRTKDRRSLGFS